MCARNFVIQNSEWDKTNTISANPVFTLERFDRKLICVGRPVSRFVVADSCRKIWFPKGAGTDVLIDRQFCPTSGTAQHAVHTQPSTFLERYEYGYLGYRRFTIYFLFKLIVNFPLLGYWYVGFNLLCTESIIDLIKPLYEITCCSKVRNM